MRVGGESFRKALIAVIPNSNEAQILYRRKYGRASAHDYAPLPPQRRQEGFIAHRGALVCRQTNRVKTLLGTCSHEPVHVARIGGDEQTSAPSGQRLAGCDRQCTWPFDGLCDSVVHRVWESLPDRSRRFAGT